MVKYSSSVMAAANLLALAQALPAQPVCSVVVQVVTGYGVWVPQPDPTWGSWVDPSKPSSKTTTTADWNTWDPSDPSKPKPTSKTTTTAEWSGWEDPSKNTKTTTKSTDSWGTWTTIASSSVKPTTTTTTAVTTTKNGGGFYTSPSSTTEPPHTTDAPSTTTTTEATTTTTTTQSTTTTTTTEAPEATSCPYYDGSSHSVLNDVQGGGSCQSDFTVQCGARVNVPQDGSVNFWERTSGEYVGSLAECIAICDSNSQCTAAIWTDYAGAGDSDKFHCWQTSGLPQPSVFGNAGTYGQLSYKGSSSAQCGQSYNAPL